MLKGESKQQEQKWLVEILANNLKLALEQAERDGNHVDVVRFNKVHCIGHDEWQWMIVWEE